MSPTKPLSLIPDADVVIYLHTVGVWESLCRATRVVLPSIVAREAQFYVDEVSGERVVIDLVACAGRGEIIILEATVEEIGKLTGLFPKMLSQSLHEGELEALALLFFGRAAECLLCTGDQAAVRAMVKLDMSDRCLSLEAVLQSSGFGRRVALHLTEERFRGYVARAQRDKITGLL